MYKIIKLNTQYLRIHIRSVLTFIAINIVGFLYLQYRGLPFIKATEGIRSLSFQGLRVQVPIFWFWFLIWGLFCTTYIIQCTVNRPSEQATLKINSRRKFWLIQFLFTTILCAVLSFVALSVLGLFNTPVSLLMLVIFPGGMALLSGVWLSLSVRFGLKIGFLLTCLFPFIGISSNNKFLPSNFLMPIRVIESQDSALAVLFRIMLYLLAFLVLGLIMYSKHEYVGKGEKDA